MARVRALGVLSASEDAGALAWAAIVPGTWEAEEHFTDLRFESQRDTLEAEAASIERLVDGRRGAITVQTTPEISPFARSKIDRSLHQSLKRAAESAAVYSSFGFIFNSKLCTSDLPSTVSFTL